MQNDEKSSHILLENANSRSPAGKGGASPKYMFCFQEANNAIQDASRERVRHQYFLGSYDGLKTMDAGILWPSCVARKSKQWVNKELLTDDGFSIIASERKRYEQTTFSTTRKQESIICNEVNCYIWRVMWDMSRRSIYTPWHFLFCFSRLEHPMVIRLKFKIADQCHPEIKKLSHTKRRRTKMVRYRETIRYHVFRMRIYPTCFFCKKILEMGI